MTQRYEHYSELIKQKALSLGFDDVGIQKVEPLYEDRKRLEDWLSKGYQGRMSFMERYIEERTNPALLVPGARSVISLVHNYFPAQKQISKQAKIAKYAYGDDYHLVLKKKLITLLAYIKTNIGEIQGRGFVDSAPVFEKSWAAKSGLGWIGKNGNLIHPKRGSFFFIAVLITDLPLYVAPTPPMQDYCGTCSKCIDACPTQAILPNKVIKATSCIAYYTIELKAAFKETIDRKDSAGWLFGCDVCQDVCPWNRFAKPHTEPDLAPYEEVLRFDIADWLGLDKKGFNKRFARSALSRAKWEGVQKNTMLFLKEA